MNIAVIVLSLFAFFLVLGFTVFIVMIAFRNKPETTKQNIDYTSDTVSQPVTSRINWTEVTRGFVPTDPLPPCYETSSECKKIFTILKSYNMEKKYMMLLDVYSMLRCQDSQMRSRACSDTFLNDRIADLNTYGGNPNDADAIKIVKSVTNLQNNKMGKLLVMATDLIEKQMKEIQNDGQISKSDKEQIVGFNSLFYRQHYDFMNKRCP